MGKTVRTFIPFSVIITLLCGLVYIVMQQSYRQNGNDPQIAYAQDIAASLNTGVTPQEIIPPSRIDMSKSLATFVMVFDNKNKLILSTGEINGKAPTIPAGVFSYVAKNGEDRVTWQPQKEVRVAIVATKYRDGYVVVGRSLKEVERRIRMLAAQVAIFWAITFIGTYISILIFPKRKSR